MRKCVLRLSCVFLIRSIHHLDLNISNVHSLVTFFFESVAGMNQTMVLIWLVESGMGRKAQVSISAKLTQKQQEFLILLGQDKYIADFAKF